MENINRYYPNFEREPLDDEYKKNGLCICKKCNTPRQFLHDWNGKKIVFNCECECQKAEREAHEKAEKERELRNKIEGLKQIGIPNPTYRGYTIDKDDRKTPSLTKIIKNYIENFEDFSENGQGLILWGSVGTGKTFYAMCIANALCENLKRVYCTSLSAVVKMAQDFDNAEAHFSRLLSQDLIIVDDLGAERGTTFAMEQIYGFIDGCNTYKIPLVITTNLTPSVLEKASQDTADLTYARIYSRILEKCYPVKVNEIKRRENNAQSNKIEMAKLLGV